jgi:WD40 repeat protein
MVKQRLFTLMVRSPHDEGSEALAKKLFDSFKIVGQVPDHFRPKGATEAFSGHTRDIDFAALSAQGDRLATVAQDGTLRVWEYPSGKEIASAELRDDFRTPNSVAFAPDGNLLAVGLGGPGEKLLLWDLASRNEKARTEAGGSAMSVAFSADGKHLIFAAGGRLYRFDPAALGKGQEIGRGDMAVLSANGKRAFAFEGEEVKVYALEGKGPPQKGPRFKDRVRALALSGDGQLLAVGTGEQVHLWDTVKGAPTGKEIRTVATEQVALSARGDLLAVRSHQGFAVYALPEGKELLKEDVPNLRRILLGPDGKLLLVQGAYVGVREPLGK